MNTITKRHLVSSGALIGTGAVVLPLLGILLEGLMEVMNQPIWVEKVNGWFGVGSVIGLLVLTVGYRLVAALYNWIQERNQPVVAKASRHEVVKI